MTPDESDLEVLKPDAVGTQKKSGKGKLFIMLGALVVLLAGGGGAAYYFLGQPAPDGHEPAQAKAAPEHSSEPPVYVEVPAMVVNLRTGSGQPGFLKLHFVFVASSESKSEEISAKLPSILDALQPFLRELRPEDLAGSAAVYRLKEEMLARAATQLTPGAVRDVLIQDLIQQ